LKRISGLKKEKGELLLQVEQEEEYLTNTLQKKLNQVSPFIYKIAAITLIILNQIMIIRLLLSCKKKKRIPFSVKRVCKECVSRECMNKKKFFLSHQSQKISSLNINTTNM